MKLKFKNLIKNLSFKIQILIKSDQILIKKNKKFYKLSFSQVQT